MTVLFLIMWHLLIGVAIFIFILGIDDIFLDFFYWIYMIYRKWKMRQYTPLTIDKLFSVPEKKMAVLIACWHEPSIERMLEYNLNEIKYQHYDIFVGVYKNDPDTIALVDQVKKYFSNVYVVISSEPGPTTKAHNLNSIYSFIEFIEKTNNIKYETYILHDAEDVIDPVAFKLYNYVIPRKDMVQIPVIPLEYSLKNLTHWTYNDEFAEIHSKDIIVREVLSGFVPSSGVGTAFSRNAIEKLKETNNGSPFSLYSLTEDYSCSLRIKKCNLKSIFMIFFVPRVVEERSFFLLGKKVIRVKKNIAATRSLFTRSYTKSVRQRTRWTLGISFQEWYHAGWPGNLATKYFLYRDRKILISHFVNLFCYILFFYWAINFVCSIFDRGIMTLNIMLDIHQRVNYLLLICSFFMMNKVVQRMIACCRIYNWRAMMLSPIRILYANVLYIHVLMRAYSQFIFKYNPKSRPVWDKTVNIFPTDDLLVQYKWQLGDILIKNKHIKRKELMVFIKKQKNNNKKIGDILFEEGIITQKKLLESLSVLFNTKLYASDSFSIVPLQEIANISKETHDWLLSNKYIPIKKIDTKITIGFFDFHSSEIKNSIRKKVDAYEVDFCFIPENVYELNPLGSATDWRKEEVFI